MIICVHLWLLFFSSAAAAQEAEIVANLAAGRVAIYVAKDGIAIGAVERRIEADSRPPAVVQLSSRRAGILLGAVEWMQPGAGAAPARMDQELLRLLGEVRGGAPRLRAEQASDIEAVGLAMLEALRKQTSQLHNKLDLKEDEPLLELLLVGYVEDYGPEVWSLRYHIVQEPLRGEFWRTRILRPRYTQLYPPEKGQPKTLMEVNYPRGAGAPGLLERLRDDPGLAAFRTSDAQIIEVSALLAQGESDKARLDAATQWLRGLLHATAPEDATQVFATITEQKGLDWVLAPKEKVEAPAPREPGAPSLRKKPGRF